MTEKIEWFVDDSIPENTVYMYSKDDLIIKKYSNGKIKVQLRNK